MTLDIHTCHIDMAERILGTIYDLASTNMKKIGIAGTHSTGKTSIVRRVTAQLHQRGISVLHIADLATAARESGFPILREHTFESTLWIMAKGITEELETARMADVLIVDRPVPDALGYLFAALQHRNATLPPTHLEYLKTLARHHATTYDSLFRTQIDPTIPIGDDKIRDMDPVFRLLAADGISRAFTECGIHCELLPTDSSAAVDMVVSAVIE